jgi:hypothetical protein
VSKKVNSPWHTEDLTAQHSGRKKMNDHDFVKKGPQTADHLLWVCELLRKQRQVLRNSIMQVGGYRPITNFDLANKYANFFQKFVNTINFKTW